LGQQSGDWVFWDVSVAGVFPDNVSNVLFAGSVGGSLWLSLFKFNSLGGGLFEGLVHKSSVASFISL